MLTKPTRTINTYINIKPKGKERLKKKKINSLVQTFWNLESIQLQVPLYLGVLMMSSGPCLFSCLYAGFLPCLSVWGGKALPQQLSGYNLPAWHQQTESFLFPMVLRELLGLGLIGPAGSHVPFASMAVGCIALLGWA